ncbi:hypothetical protein CCR75_006579 [Bremia lactucae]|uniref:Uncharacterized protein n=1 Tax=Bremia lactucae TaxID=4779 RepID=A0A976FH37_BRELC|nr:hypothetical protein CCR75_006579 [Bremia lactucae]
MQHIGKKHVVSSHNIAKLQSNNLTLIGLAHNCIFFGGTNGKAPSAIDTKNPTENNSLNSFESSIRGAT